MRLEGIRNLIDQPIYDTMQLAAAAGQQTVNFFTVPFAGILAGAVLKTYTDTNLIQAGRLEKGLELTIDAVSLHVRPTAAGGARVTWADYRSVYNESFLRLWIGQVSFLDTCLQNVPAGCSEMKYFSNIAPAATEFMANHGTGSFFNRFTLDNPLTLEDQESINVQLTVNNAIVAVTDVCVVVWGSMTRPVR